MRKFNNEVTRNGRTYTDELRQKVANRVDYLLATTTNSSWNIWHQVGEEFDVSWGTARRYHNALGNSPSARGNKKRNSVNVKPIEELQYSEAMRHVIMQLAMKSSVVKVSKMLNIGNTTIYDWLKAYGLSTAYFNRNK